MKKISRLLLIIPIIAFFAFQNVFGLGVMSRAQDSIFMGQKHNYHVIFRGNGEAIVYANIEFTNTTDNTINEYVFESPVEIKDVTVYQYYQNDGYPTYRYGYDSSYSSYPSYYSNLYTKLKFDTENNKFVVKLSKEVATNAQGKLLLGFSSRSYTNGLLGGYDYTFKAFRVDSRIESLRINISVDSDLLLKGAQSTVGVDTGTSSPALDATITNEKAVASQSMDNVLNSINYGTINKSFTQVASDEEVAVSGEYSSNIIRLYAKEISITVLVIILIVAAGIVIKKRLPKDDSVQSKKKDSSAKSVRFVDVMLGVTSGFFVMLLTVLITYIGNSIGYMGSYGAMSGLVHLAFAVVSILIYLLSTLTLPMVRGIKNGWLSFVVVLVSEILFLIILMLLFVLIFSPVIYNTTYPIY
jgi:hypothetical protein